MQKHLRVLTCKSIEVENERDTYKKKCKKIKEVEKIITTNITITLSSYHLIIIFASLFKLHFDLKTSMNLKNGVSGGT